MDNPNFRIIIFKKIQTFFKLGIGERLKEFYESKNYTQKAFSESVNLNKTTINNIVLGVSKPSFPVIEQIAKFHKDLDLRWLILGTEKEESKVLYENLEEEIEMHEPSEPYRRAPLHEVTTLYIEKECKLTGGKCAFDMLPELKAENEGLKKEIEKLKKKK